MSVKSSRINKRNLTKGSVKKSEEKKEEEPKEPLEDPEEAAAKKSVAEIQNKARELMDRFGYDCGYGMHLRAGGFVPRRYPTGALSTIPLARSPHAPRSA
jgi:hypothetical protein